MFVPERRLGPDKLLVQDIPVQGDSEGQLLEYQITGDQCQLTPFDADNDPGTYESCLPDCELCLDAAHKEHWTV